MIDKFKKLNKAIVYLETQLKITKRFCDEKGKEHIDSVLKNVNEILNSETLEKSAQMDLDFVNLIKQWFKEKNTFEENEKVVLAHFSCVDLLKNHITVKKNYSELVNNYFLEDDYFVNNIQIYFTNHLPKNHFSVITRKEYEEFKSKNL